jgi:hypothetical protein
MTETPTDPLQNEPPFGSGTEWSDPGSGGVRDPQLFGDLARGVIRHLDATVVGGVRHHQREEEPVPLSVDTASKILAALLEPSRTSPAPNEEILEAMYQLVRARQHAGGADTVD